VLVTCDLQVTIFCEDMQDLSPLTPYHRIVTHLATPSALDEALARIGDRWTLLIVEALLAGSRRFNELQRDVPGLAPNILSDRLKRLERDGLILGRPYSERPVRLAYELTGDGLGLAGVLRLLVDWGARRSERAESMRHPACGTPLEARWYCPTCARMVAEDEAAELRHL
jgi:DNA-binding HxlR family transcriptional regulator